MSAQKTPGVIALMGSVDDHLQAMQHYGHGRDQREAMGMVQELMDAMEDLCSVVQVLHPATVGDQNDQEQKLNTARWVLAKATGSAV